MRCPIKLVALRDFLRSSIWHTFAASNAYKAFARKYKAKIIPMLVHFVDDGMSLRGRSTLSGRVSCNGFDHLQGLNG